MTAHRRWPHVTNPRDSRRRDVQVAETSARAFVPEAPRDTAPSPPLDPARYPHLQLIQCSKYPARITVASCRAQHELARKSRTGPGKGAIDVSEKNTSACRWCEAGAQRCGKPPIVAKTPAKLSACACGEPVSPPLVRCPACLARHQTTQGHGMRIGKGREPQAWGERRAKG